jgi:hypothetical protein
VMAIEADAALDFGDGVIGKPHGGVAMATLVVVGFFQLHLCQSQMFESRLHARLIGAGAPGYEPRGNCGNDEKSDDETMQFHGISSLSH